MDDVVFALLITTLAGLSTGLGGAVVFFQKRPNISILCMSLGLSAGVMVYISFMELLPYALDSVGEVSGLLAFFVGIIAAGIIDMMLPKRENPHHYSTLTGADHRKCRNRKQMKMDCRLMRVGVFTAIAIAVHKFPEGIAIFSASLTDATLGIGIAIAIALHNIPEGISVAAPIYCATRKKGKAFSYAFLSGLAEPVGGLVCYLLLYSVMTTAFLAGTLAFVAGIMVYISMDEILPTAHSYGKSHLVLIGFIFGMFIMALTLALL